MFSYSRSSRFNFSSARTTSPTCCALSRDGHQQRVRRIHHDQVLDAQQRHHLAARIHEIVVGIEHQRSGQRSHCRARRVAAVRRPRSSSPRRSSRNRAAGTPCDIRRPFPARRNRSRCSRSAESFRPALPRNRELPNGGRDASMVAVFGRCWRSSSSSTSAAPEKHAGVPEVIARRHVPLRLGGNSGFSWNFFTGAAVRRACAAASEIRRSRSRSPASAAECPPPSSCPAPRP